jgi:hypothetical protein
MLFSSISIEILLALRLCLRSGVGGEKSDAGVNGVYATRIKRMMRGFVWGETARCARFKPGTAQAYFGSLH